MPKGPEDTRIEVSGNTLRVFGDLGPDEVLAFRKAAQDLVETEHGDLVMDLAGTRYIGSVYVRDIALVMLEAKKLGRSVSVRTTRSVARILSMVGVDKLGDIQVADEDGAL